MLHPFLFTSIFRFGLFRSVTLFKTCAALVVRLGHCEICCYRLLLLFGLLHRLIRLLILFGLEVEPVWYKNKIPSILGRTSVSRVFIKWCVRTPSVIFFDNQYLCPTIMINANV